MTSESNLSTIAALARQDPMTGVWDVDWTATL